MLIGAACIVLGAFILSGCDLSLYKTTPINKEIMMPANEAVVIFKAFDFWVWEIEWRGGRYLVNSEGGIVEVR